MNKDARYKVEEAGNGFLVADYTGGRGKVGAAYAGGDGIWHDQPSSVLEVFPSESAATTWAITQTFSDSEVAMDQRSAKIDVNSLAEAEELIPTGANGKTLVLKFACTKRVFMDLAIWGMKYGTKVVLPKEFVVAEA